MIIIVKKYLKLMIYINFYFFKFFTIKLFKILMSKIIDEKPLINLEFDYYSSIISQIIIGGWDENDINKYYNINNTSEIEIPKMKVLFSIPFNSDFSNFDVNNYIKYIVYFSR